MITDKSKETDISTQEKSHLIPSGTSPTQRSVSHVLQGNGNLVEVSSRRNSVAKRTVAEVWEKGEKQSISFSGRDDTVTVSITTPTHTKLSKKAWKIYEFLRHKVNEQCDFACDPRDQKQLLRSYIEFDLEEMVSNGMYKDTHTAGAAFKEVLPSISTDLYIFATAVVHGKLIEIKGNMFTGNYKRTNGRILLYINQDPIFWKIYNQFITYLPTWYFRTDRKTQILTSLIADEARLMDKQRKLINCGSFSVSVKSVWEAMNLPYAKGTAPKGADGKPIAKETTHGKQDIIAPIESAVDEITALERNSETAAGIRVTLSTKSGKCYLDERATEFLADGVLIVELSGSYLKKMTSYNREIDTERKKAEKRHEKAQIAAEAALLKKKMEKK